MGASLYPPRDIKHVQSWVAPQHTSAPQPNEHLKPKKDLNNLPFALVPPVFVPRPSAPAPLALLPQEAKFCTPLLGVGKGERSPRTAHPCSWGRLDAQHRQRASQHPPQPLPGWILYEHYWGTTEPPTSPPVLLHSHLCHQGQLDGSPGTVPCAAVGSREHHPLHPVLAHQCHHLAMLGWRGSSASSRLGLHLCAIAAELVSLQTPSAQKVPGQGPHWSLCLSGPLRWDG